MWVMGLKASIINIVQYTNIDHVPKKELYT